MYCIGEDYKYRGEEGAQPPMAGAQPLVPTLTLNLMGQWHTFIQEVAHKPNMPK
jgi:hypothetical protein